VFAEDEAALLLEAARDAAELERLAARRIAGEPLEYVLGWAEFAGRRLRVAPGVFVPRRRTELLLRLALEAAGAAASAPRVLELCCGVAPVATLLAAALPRAVVTAADLDPAAVAVAHANLARGTVLEGDLFAPLPAGSRYDVIVANAPYVPREELRNLPREARDFEHPLALDGGDDGLALHRRIAAEAAAWLAPGGVVLVETSRRQALRDGEIFASHGWRVRLERDEELDATAVHATRP
jgi:release factor glutamine methyltransferase